MSIPVVENSQGMAFMARKALMNQSVISNKNKQYMWDVNGKEKGVITSQSERYCAGCGRVHTCFVVRWSDGKLTKPCSAMVKRISDTEFQICHTLERLNESGLSITI